MEKTNKVEVNATEPVDQQVRPRVVFVTDEPLPEALRALFPDAEIVSPSKPEPVDDRVTAACEPGGPCHESVFTTQPFSKVRATADATLMSVAAKYGLVFNQQEIDALFTLSMAFSPAMAIAVAHSACKQYAAAWEKAHG